jgi:hypothetical protein
MFTGIWVWNSLQVSRLFAVTIRIIVSLNHAGFRAFNSLLQVTAAASSVHLLDKIHTLTCHPKLPQQFGSVVEILSPTILKCIFPWFQSKATGEEGMPLYTCMWFCEHVQISLGRSQWVLLSKWWKSQWFCTSFLVCNFIHRLQSNPDLGNLWRFLVPQCYNNSVPVETWTLGTIGSQKGVHGN